MGECFTSGLFCLHRKNLAYEYFLTIFFNASPNPQAGGPPLVGCPRLLIQFIRSYPPYRRPFLHPQPEDAPCRGDRDPQTRINLLLQIIDKMSYRKSRYPHHEERIKCVKTYNSSISFPSCSNFS